MTIAARTGRIREKVASRLGRSDRSAFGLWFWEIDRVLLLLVFVLISVGLIAVAAASPAAADRYSGGNVVVAPLHYFWRQLGWVALGLPVMIGVSMMPVQLARRFALGSAAFFSVMLALVPLIGSEANGARRWIGVGIGQFQPSEFLKPFFVVSLAWLLSLRAQDKSLPVIPLSGILTGLIAILLMKQPDFGQTIIFGCMWLALLMLAGVPIRIMGMLAGAGAVGVVLAYLFYPVATQRIDNFLFSAGDTYQVDSAHATLVAGGFFGTGPGGGEMKFHLPEAHTDYIFSVIGEEFGLFACIAIAALFLAIVVRVFVKLLDEEDPFVVMAAAGLTVQFAIQALINMAVNVNLAPSKGMTLPFISYGGSSMLALSAGFGLLLAFTRRNPYLTRSPYVVKWSGR
ncbi:MAG: cell division protein FtsW [Sphingomonadaceae bacterium]|nr:cell division protein FtsW [Sphingomonadaceae bacterium]